MQRSASGWGSVGWGRALIHRIIKPCLADAARLLLVARVDVAVAAGEAHRPNPAGRPGRPQGGGLFCGATAGEVLQQLNNGGEQPTHSAQPLGEVAGLKARPLAQVVARVSTGFPLKHCGAGIRWVNGEEGKQPRVSTAADGQHCSLAHTSQSLQPALRQKNHLVVHGGAAARREQGAVPLAHARVCGGGGGGQTEDRNHGKKLHPATFWTARQGGQARGENGARVTRAQFSRNPLTGTPTSARYHSLRR